MSTYLTLSADTRNRVESTQTNSLLVPSNLECSQSVQPLSQGDAGDNDL